MVFLNEIIENENSILFIINLDDCFLGTLNQFTHNKFLSADISIYLSEIVLFDYLQFKCKINVENLGFGKLEDIGKCLLVKNIPLSYERLAKDKFSSYEGLIEIVYIKDPIASPVANQWYYFLIKFIVMHY